VRIPAESNTFEEGFAIKKKKPFTAEQIVAITPSLSSPKNTCLFVRIQVGRIVPPCYSSERFPIMFVGGHEIHNVIPTASRTHKAAIPEGDAYYEK
jgi:hypothetical protein